MLRGYQNVSVNRQYMNLGGNIMISDIIWTLVAALFTYAVMWKMNNKDVTSK